MRGTAEEHLRTKKAIMSLPALTIGQIREEIENDENFKHYARGLIANSDPYAEVLASQRKAILNELNPANYPETCGLWKRLRRCVKQSDRKSGVGDWFSDLSKKYGRTHLGKADKQTVEKWEQEYAEATSEAEKRMKKLKEPKLGSQAMKAVQYAFLGFGMYNIIREIRGQR